MNDNWPKCEVLVDLARDKKPPPSFRFGRDFSLKPLQFRILEFYADFTKFTLKVAVPDRDAESSFAEVHVRFNFNWDEPAKDDDELMKLSHNAIQRIVSHEIYERLYRGDRRYKEMHPKDGVAIL